MTNNWIHTFYQMQYQAISDIGIPSEYYGQLAEKIIEEVGKPFQTVLELGAGDGRLAHNLAAYTGRITTLELVQDMVDTARQNNTSNIQSICGDFYNVELNDTYDVLLYIDGFGVGEDEDQIKLLKRIYNWINDDGCALIDVYNPTHWKKAHGIEMFPDPRRNPDVKRLYEYDFDGNKMMDTWWNIDIEGNAQTQYLRCYTPKEMHHMCQSADLDITAYFPGGSMDYDEGIYHEPASLEECMSYRVKVKKKIY